MSTVVAVVWAHRHKGVFLFDPYGNQSKNHPRLHHPVGGGSLCKEADDVVLRSLAHAAFQRQGLAGHILEIRHGQLDADTADLRLSVAVVAHGRHLDVGLESVRVGVPELLELGRPCLTMKKISPMKL